jgi:hypothetical protein
MVLYMCIHEASWATCIVERLFFFAILIFACPCIMLLDGIPNTKVRTVAAAINISRAVHYIISK